MIQLEKTEIKFSNMGYFVGSEGWMHPDITIKTYEIIFVTGGEVFIREDETDYVLRKGDLLVLRPNVRHLGYKSSDNASFFWLHFYAKNYEEIGAYFFHPGAFYHYELLFRRLNHLATIGADRRLIECEIALILLGSCERDSGQSKLFSDVAEYVRIHVATAPTVAAVADVFGYHPDYLSKIFIKNTGMSLKKYIDRERNEYVKSMLLNTNLTVKEIAYSAHFADDGAFIKFFRYNNGQTPSQFRSKYHATHTNNK